MDNQFDNNWIKKDKKNNSFDSLKESLKPQQPLKPKMEIAKNKIQMQNKKLDAMLDLHQMDNAGRAGGKAAARPHKPRVSDDTDTASG